MDALEHLIAIVALCVVAATFGLMIWAGQHQS
jgi:hypothetical protein